MIINDTLRKILISEILTSIFIGNVHATSGSSYGLDIGIKNGSIHNLNYGIPCGSTQRLVLGIVFVKWLPSHNSDYVILKTSRATIKISLQEEQVIEYHGRLRHKQLWAEREVKWLLTKWKFVIEKLNVLRLS